MCNEQCRYTIKRAESARRESATHVLYAHGSCFLPPGVAQDENGISLSVSELRAREMHIRHGHVMDMRRRTTGFAVYLYARAHGMWIIAKFRDHTIGRAGAASQCSGLSPDGCPTRE